MPRVLLADVVAPVDTLSRVNRECFEIIPVSRVHRDYDLLFNLLDVVKLATKDGWEDALDGRDRLQLVLSLVVLFDLEFEEEA